MKLAEGNEKCWDVPGHKLFCAESAEHEKSKQTTTVCHYDNSYLNQFSTRIQTATQLVCLHLQFNPIQAKREKPRCYCLFRVFPARMYCIIQKCTFILSSGSHRCPHRLLLRVEVAPTENEHSPESHSLRLKSIMLVYHSSAWE